MFIVKKSQIQELIPFLKQRGLRITTQRLLILTTIISLEDHPTVEDIHRELPYISVGTIYKNVKLFVSLRILNELPYGIGITKYELNDRKHYHVICESCGKISDFHYPDLDEVEEAASRLTKYDVNIHHLEFYGVCTTCQS
jgi:Fur family transcriptional regulator, peroxide stress response regulator